MGRMYPNVFFMVNYFSGNDDFSGNKDFSANSSFVSDISTALILIINNNIILY